MPRYSTPSNLRNISFNAAELSQRDAKVGILPHNDKKYNDAFSIAAKALKALQRNDEDTVYGLIGNNPRLNLTVTWNYLIRYKLEKGRFNAAMSDYQQMKKRGHFPDTYTYTTLLKGCDDHYEKGGRPKLNVLLDLLFRDPRVKPLTIHLNAALKACRYRDLDYAREIHEQFVEDDVPEDIVTYTSLLHLLRQGAEQNRKTSHGKAQVVDETTRELIDQADSIWQRARTRWIAGEIQIDSKFVKVFMDVMSTGDVNDNLKALKAIIEVCELPQPDKQTQERLGQHIRLDEVLFTKLLYLCTRIGRPQLMEHYWKQAKIAAAGQLSLPVYHARLNALNALDKPDLATELLDEMIAERIELTPETIFLGLRCQAANPKESLKQTITFMDKFCGSPWSPKLINLRVIMEFCRILKFRKDSSTEREDTRTALTMLSHLNWERIAETAQSTPHQSNNLADAIRIIRGKCTKQQEFSSDRAIASLGDRMTTLLKTHYNRPLRPLPHYQPHRPKLTARPA